MFKRINNPRAIITTYPASYSATNHSERWSDVDNSGPCWPCRKIDDQRHVSFDPEPGVQMAICRTRRVQVGRTMSFKHDVNRMKRPSKPVLVSFLAAGFNFALGTRVKEVPCNKSVCIYFFSRNLFLQMTNTRTSYSMAKKLRSPFVPGLMATTFTTLIETLYPIYTCESLPGLPVSKFFPQSEQVASPASLLE